MVANEITSTEPFYVYTSSKTDVALIRHRGLEKLGFLNGFSTRAGGLSGPHNDQLNLAYKNDERTRVDANRARFLLSVGAPDFRLIEVTQIHSSTVVEGEKVPHDPIEADGLVSRQPETLIGVKTADCCPILIADSHKRAYAAVHAGWRGTVGQIVRQAIQSMNVAFGSSPADLVGAIGPSACGDCYEVGRDVADAVANLPGSAAALNSIQDRDDKYRLNVAHLNAAQMIEAGMRPAAVDVAPYCTIHQPDLFFSHRRDGHLGGAKFVGRMMSIIGLA